MSRTKRIAFDLDDTLLVSSWTHAEHWHTSRQVKIRHCWPLHSWRGLHMRALRTRGISRIAHLWKTPPVVEVQVRPDALKLLENLRNQNIELALVTACRKVRVEFLKSSLPELFEFFPSTHVVCQEDLVKVLLDLQKNGTDQGLLGAKLHLSEPASLAHKTPLVVSKLVPGWEDYDLLIDDSTETKSAFEQYGLGHKLVSVDGQAKPLSNLMYHVEQNISERLNQAQSDLNGTMLNTVRPTEEVEIDSVLRLIDPFYIPTITKSLMIGNEPGHTRSCQDLNSDDQKLFHALKKD